MQRPEDGKKGPKGGGARGSSCPKLGPLEMHIPTANPLDGWIRFLHFVRKLYLIPELETSIAFVNCV